MNTPPVATGRHTVSGVLWVGSSFGVQAIAQFAVLALLARFLTATEFGLVSAALVVVGLMRVVTDSLVGPAVTQRRELTDAHIRTAFSLSVYIGTAAAVALWFTAGWVANLFAMPGLVPVVRGLAPLLFIDSLSTVPIALLQRDLAFRRLAKLEGASFIIGFALPGCALAVMGAGVWALIAAELAYVTVRSLVAFVARSHPRSFGLSPAAARDVLGYGGGHTLGRLFNYGALQGDYFVVGRWLSAASLGIYGRAYQLAVKPGMYLGQALDKVIFPVMSSLQEDRPRLAESYRRTVSLAASLSAPASVVGVVLGPELVWVVLGPRWEAVIVPFQILAAGLLPRTGYKPSDSLARAAGTVYRRAWRQAVYAMLVVGGALVGSRWGLPAVAAFVLLAIVANYAMMADLSLRVIGMSWPTFLRAHVRGLSFAGMTAAVSLPAASMFRGRDMAPWLVLTGTLLLVTLVAGLVIATAPARVLGPDLGWLLTLIRRQMRWGATSHPAGGQTPPRATDGSVPANREGEPVPAKDCRTREVVRSRGAIVAVVGADGSGKSTLTQDLVDTLGAEHRVIRLYLGSGDGPAAWYRAPMKLARNVVSPPKRRQNSGAPTAARPRRELVVARALWAITLALEKVSKTRRAQRARNRGVLIICDRYPQTQFPGGNDGPLLHSWLEDGAWPLRSLARWEVGAYERATEISPDLLVKLDVPISVALERRPGLDAAYLESRTSLIRDLDLGCAAVVIDAAAPYGQVRQRAIDAIVEVPTVGTPSLG